ncbi:hypothetical protein RHGRI_015028 [Rhododendron griersonianum]|uniref:Uncharacterized protein n=1 Tax=Rhododendron griersonianum TaxID=479676 RepID=A0AAV6KBN4_9ERIC|nr:hypothetical protein RHGRI_015028 [Rhododendron griersonianum]
MVELSKPQLWFLRGVSSGVGKETTLVLALHGVHIVMGVRNTDSGRKVREVILEENSNAKIDVKELDLNSMASARNFSSEFNSLGLPLNLLIINAGVFASPFMLSQDNKIAVWDKSFRYSRINMVFVERIFVISYCKRHALRMTKCLKLASENDEVLEIGFRE